MSMWMSAAVGQVWQYVVLLLSCALCAAGYLMFVHDLYWGNHINGRFSKEMTASVKDPRQGQMWAVSLSWDTRGYRRLARKQNYHQIRKKGHCDTWKMSNTAQYLPFKWFQECIWHLNIDWKWSKTVSMWGTNNKSRMDANILSLFTCMTVCMHMLLLFYWCTHVCGTCVKSVMWFICVCTYGMYLCTVDISIKINVMNVCVHNGSDTLGLFPYICMYICVI